MYSIPFQMFFHVSVSLCFSCVLVFFCFLLVYKFSPSRYERRGDFSIKDGSERDARIRWMKLDMVFSICINEGYTLHHFARCPPRDKYCCFSILAAFL